MEQKEESSSARIWELMGNTFYSVFFALLLSAVMLWERGVFHWTGTEHYLYSSFGIVMVLVYFVFDWYDANLAPAIDPRITERDIFLWLLSGVWISSIGILIIRRDDINVLFLTLFAGVAFSVCTILFRNNRLDIQKREIDWAAPGSSDYDKTMAVYRWCKNVVIFDMAILMVAVLMLVIHHQGAKGGKLALVFDFLYRNEMQVLSILVLLFLFPTLLLKYFRNRWILRPLSKHRKKYDKD
jgi:hypothetical protein